MSNLKIKLENIKKEIEINKKKKFDKNLFETLSLRFNSNFNLGSNSKKQNHSRTNNTSSFLTNIIPLRSRRILQGHFGKIYAATWCGDSQHILSASQDGKLMLWNGFSTNKLLSITLKSSWVITCAYEQRTSSIIACGGMDNICSIYRIDQPGPNCNAYLTMELCGHRGYLSSCSFVNDSRIVTASGDGHCILWDVQQSRPVVIFSEHSSDVMSCEVSKHDTNIFVSGSCDTTAKIWDIRTNRSITTFRYHASDVNSVSFFPDGNAVVSGSDDHTCHVLDLRSYQSLGCFGNDEVLYGITNVAFSHSGRILFTSYEDNTIRGWDLFRNPSGPCALQLTGHEARVSCLSMSPSGESLLSGSWDNCLRIWA